MDSTQGRMPHYGLLGLLALSVVPGWTTSARAAIGRYLRRSDEAWAKSGATSGASVEDLEWVLEEHVIDRDAAVAQGRACWQIVAAQDTVVPLAP